MGVVIRLSRRGAKNRPFYRLMVADKKAPIKGKFIEQVGTYNPFANRYGYRDLRIVPDRIKYWLSVGAQPSKTVNRLLFYAAMLPKPITNSRPLEDQSWKARMLRDPETAKLFTKHMARGMWSGTVGELTPPPNASGNAASSSPSSEGFSPMSNIKSQLVDSSSSSSPAGGSSSSGSGKSSAA